VAGSKQRGLGLQQDLLWLEVQGAAVIIGSRAAVIAATIAWVSAMIACWAAWAAACAAAWTALKVRCSAWRVWMTNYRPCAEEACGNIVDVNHESKVVRLKLLHLIVDQSLHWAWHLNQAWHWASIGAPFLALTDFTVRLVTSDQICCDQNPISSHWHSKSVKPKQQHPSDNTLTLYSHSALKK
jgi:hypothetical protein